MQTIFGFFEPLYSFKLTKFEFFFAEKNVNSKKDKILNQKFLLTTKLSKILFPIDIMKFNLDCSGSS